MAIQVGGTQVISNSQGLTNISSIDSTTAAAIGAGGVGGTDLTFTASSNISKGQPIAISTSGQAEPVRLTNCSTKVQFTASGFTAFISNVGQILHIANISDENVYMLMGHNSYTNYIAFIIMQDDGTYTYKGSYSIGGYSGGNYERAYDAATDGQGNWAVCYGHYHGSSGTHYKRIVTFSTDSSYNVSNIGSSGVIDGDNYNFNWRVASYDTNRFCLVYRSNQSTNGYLKWQTFYRNGSSYGGLNSGTLGSTGGKAVVHNAVGHIDPLVNTNQMVITGNAEAGNTTFGKSGSSGATGWATVLTFSSNTPSIGTVYKTNTQNLTANGNNPENNYNHRRFFNTYLPSFRSANRNDGTLWQKTSSSSTVLTEGVSYGGDSGNTLPYDIYNFDLGYAGNTLYAVQSGKMHLWNLLPAEYTIEDGDFFGTETTVGTPPTTNGVCAHENSNGKLHVINVSNTSIIYHIITLGNVTGLYGVAKAAATSGNSVGMAVQGQIVDGYSGLTIGKGVGFNNDGTAIVSSGAPRVGVAVATDKILVDTIGI